MIHRDKQFRKNEFRGIFHSQMMIRVGRLFSENFGFLA